MDKKSGILVVDDEEDIVELLYDDFKDNYDVYKAYSGQQALDIIEKNEIHLVLTDQRMPHMTGTELLSTLNTDKPEITRFLMTGYTDLSAAIDSINKGSIHQYLTKPLDFEKLSDLIEGGLKHYEEAINAKNMITNTTDDVMDKLRGVFSKLDDIEVDKGALQEELKAAKDLEDDNRKKLELQINQITVEKKVIEQKLVDTEELLKTTNFELENKSTELEKVKDLEDDFAKLQSQMEESKQKFIASKNKIPDLEVQIKSLTDELNVVKTQKVQSDKKLKLFKDNWGNSVS